MKIAYGSYATPTIPLEELIPLLRGLGYDGLEICLRKEPHQSAPDQFEPGRRDFLKSLFEIHRVEVPALMLTDVKVLAKDEADHAATRDYLCQAAELARDFGLADPPMLALGIGGKMNEWPEIRQEIADRLRDLAELGAAEDFVIAAEAHCNAAVDRSERAAWLFETVNHPRAKLHFDIVHFFLSGEPEAESVRRMLPYTAHTHIMDAVKFDDGKFEFRILGEGELDILGYLQAMKQGGWDGFITLEVSAMIWSREDYDPVRSATSAYKVLNKAFVKAGIG